MADADTGRTMTDMVKADTDGNGEVTAAELEVSFDALPPDRYISLELPGASHLVNVDQPQEFKRILMEFLESL